jgi:hypothetical protein
MKTKTETFEVASGMVVVGDPCYDSNKTFPALNGGWEAAVDTILSGDWGHRISRITVHHEDFDPSKTKVVNGTFSVDSGQAGVFCSGSYGFEGSFYDSCCKKTLSRKGYGFVAGGFVSSSGYGDGFYEYTVHTVRGKAVCVELEFIER